MDNIYVFSIGGVIFNLYIFIFKNRWNRKDFFSKFFIESYCFF